MSKEKEEKEEEKKELLISFTDLDIIKAKLNRSDVDFLS